MTDLTIVTVASDLSRLDRLLQSCSRFDVMPVILGAGCEYPSNSFKLHLMRRKLDQLTGLAMFVDGYDTILIRDPRQAVQEFRATGKSIIFGAEKNCFPDQSLWALYPESPTAYRYLNSGVYIGESDALRRVLDQIDWKANVSDQYLLTRYYLAHQDEIALDLHCHFFQCMLWAESEFENGQNKITGSRPFVAHGNGGSSLPGTTEGSNDAPEGDRAG